MRAYLTDKIENNLYVPKLLGQFLSCTSHFLPFSIALILGVRRLRWMAKHRLPTSQSSPFPQVRTTVRPVACSLNSCQKPGPSAA
jgi:hypothetical protein